MREQEEEEEAVVKTSVEWLIGLSKGSSHELEARSLHGMKVLQARRGFFCCGFTVASNLSDGDGNWHVGAIATMIDDVGAAAIYSVAGRVKASVDFSISFFSTAKIQEEVVIEAKVVGEKERLTSVVVKITRKTNGELIALGKQWMASNNNSIPTSQSSKL